MVLTSFLVMDPGGLNAEAADQPPGDSWVQKRLQFTYRPDHHAPTAVEGQDLDYPDPLGIYQNWVESLNDGDLLSLRLYGEPGEGPPDLYSSLDDSFNASVIPKDSASFNPAIVRDGDTATGIKGCGETDGHLKKHLRAWYEPEHPYTGPRGDAGFFSPPTVADVLQLESTYYLVHALDSTSLPMCEGTDASRIPLPTDGSAGALTLSGVVGFLDDTGDWPQPGLSSLREVRVTEITPDLDDPAKSSALITRDDLTLDTGHVVQMFDHIYRFDGRETDFQGNPRAKFTIWYAGNTSPDSRTTVLLPAETPKWVTRANNLFDDPAHPDENPTQPRTSFLHVDTFGADHVTLDVGKNISGGDTFYVDGVRYDFPSVWANPGPGGDELHQITMRTPLPKGDPGTDAGGCPETWTSLPQGMIEALTRETCLHGQWQLNDWSVVSTQRLVQFDHDDPLPVNPPFNQEHYRQVDDTDLVLWEPGPAPETDCTNADTFPWGQRNDPLPTGNGMPRFGQGHVHVTQQEPPQTWIDCWDAQPTDADSLTQRITDATMSEPGLNPDAWALTGGTLPVEPVDAQTNLYWVKEWCEGRFHTNLLEIPDLLEAPQYTHYPIGSHPCAFTELVLPDRSNAHSSLEGRTLETGKHDLAVEGPGKRLNFGDYLVTTSYRLQDHITRFAFTHKPDPQDHDVDLDASNDIGDRGDLWVQTVSTTMNGTALDNTTLRLHGAPELRPVNYTQPWHPFDPEAIASDSVSFNPAVILNEDHDFTGRDSNFGWMKSCEEQDSHLKHHLRMWYEPEHAFFGPRVVNGTPPHDPTIVDALLTESTFQLVDSGQLVPRTICEDTRLAFPVEGYQAFAHPNGTFVVDGDAQPGLNTMRSVTVGNVSSGGDHPTNGTIELIRKTVTLENGTWIQMFDHLFVFEGIENTGSGVVPKFEIHYLGNPVADSPQVHNVDPTKRQYVTRGNNLKDEPSHGWPPQELVIATTFIDFTQGSWTDDSATFDVGKQLAKNDTFYVNGVRYDLPAVVVESGTGEASSLTLRATLPKSDPNRGNHTTANYTSVPDDQLPAREDYSPRGGEEWVVVDGTVVSSQWLRQVDRLDPIPLMPPFNGVTGQDGAHYRMVDDTDVRLWQPGTSPTTGCTDADTFPWGSGNDGLGEGNGLPRFPLGHTYLTDPDPPADWLDCFDAEPTGYADLGTRLRSNEPPEEPGVNHHAWNFTVGIDGDGFPVLPQRANTTLFWLKEWCDGRYHTNLFQQMTQDVNDNTTSFERHQVDSEGCAYTEFVLPDRSNPFSELAADLETLKDDQVPAGLYKLLGGDYHVATSLILQELDLWVNWYDGHSDADVTAAGHEELDYDCVISMAEVMVAVNQWFAGEIPMHDASDPDTPQLSRVISDWNQSNLGDPDNPNNNHVHYPGCSHPPI